MQENPVVIPQFHSLSGRLTWSGIEILSGVKVAEILRVARFIDPRTQIVSRWPRGTFESPQESEQLCLELDSVLKMTRTKKGGKSVGFLTLQTDGYGRYWFKPQRSFYAAVEESLASLEQLADELGEAIDAPANQAVNATYRRLAGILEQ